MRTYPVIFALGGLLVATGCGSTPPTKAGGESPPITLTAVATTAAGFPGGDQLAYFASRVGDLSAGDIRVDILGATDAAHERDTVESVQTGKVDIGMVPARVFDTMEVTSLRALQAPFLIDRNAVADAVLADPLADDMLAGLDDIGLTGLALTFDSLRQPMGTPDPLLAPADFDGATVAVLSSATQQAAYRALGAEITEAVDAELTVGINEGTIQGRDGSIQVVPGATLGPITANATLGLKANTLFADSNLFDGLTSGQQQVLRQAAAETRDWAATQHVSLAEAARSYCAAGHGDVVLSNDAQLAAMYTAVEPVYAELEADEFTRQAIERIREVEASTPEQPDVAACTSASTGESTTDTAPAATDAASTDDQTAIDGVWRWEVTLDPTADRPDAARQASMNNGTLTFEFNNGHRLATESSGNQHYGTYVLHGDQIDIVDDDGVEGHYVWHRDGDTMQWVPLEGWLNPVDDELERAFLSNPMQRIGDPTIDPGNQG